MQRKRAGYCLSRHGDGAPGLVAERVTCGLIAAPIQLRLFVDFSNDSRRFICPRLNFPNWALFVYRLTEREPPTFCSLIPRGPVSELDKAFGIHCIVSSTFSGGSFIVSPDLENSFPFALEPFRSGPTSMDSSISFEYA